MTEPERRWIAELTDDESRFLKKFLLASGSLKRLAQEYGVSYPTIRLRLDHLIDRVRRSDDNEEVDELRNTVRRLVERGELSVASARKLVKAHNKDMEKMK